MKKSTSILSAVLVFSIAGVSLIGFGSLQTALSSLSISLGSTNSLQGETCLQEQDENTFIEFGGGCIDKPDPDNDDPDLAPGGWINPVVGVNVGHPGAPITDGLIPFTEAGNSKGVIIDQAFINANRNKPWYKS